MTTIDMHNPEEAKYFAICQVKGMLKLAALGMQHSRVSKRQLMQHARDLTGQNFKARDYDGAIKALEDKRDAILAARAERAEA